MTINQAFEILKDAGGIRAARIITDNTKYFSRIRVWRMACALRRGVPVAKIIHQKWFYGIPFYTNKYTLDPRPDTETLVAAVIADNPAAPKILDLGTGTGCIIISLVKNIHGAHGVGIDISRGAIRVARQNIKNFDLSDKIKITRASFDTPHAVHEKFDIIVSNPPYIARDDARVDAGARHDPRVALYADRDGAAAYESIARYAKNWIAPGGKIYLEIGDGMEKTVRKIFENAGWKFIRAECDLGNIVRVLVFKI
ncbi:MAG: peptide chain release factor N(5)-glutamine methyltransferase [Alphaproteobacteria bacterium]|nr:peptide chain release factor N(5)-glutamine methyltransferase [Alphaproteobacteria bacterium]